MQNQTIDPMSSSPFKGQAEISYLKESDSDVSFSPRILNTLNQEIKAAVRKAALQKLES